MLWRRPRAFSSFSGFFVPAVLGNIAGGVVLVALLNYAQTSRRRFPDRDVGVLELAWRAWLLERHAGQPGVPSDEEGAPVEDVSTKDASSY